MDLGAHGLGLDVYVVSRFGKKRLSRYHYGLAAAGFS